MCRVELSLLFFLFHLSFFCLLFLFACVVLPHYVVNKDEYISTVWLANRLARLQSMVRELRRSLPRLLGGLQQKKPVAVVAQPATLLGDRRQSICCSSPPLNGDCFMMHKKTALEFSKPSPACWIQYLWRRRTASAGAGIMSAINDAYDIACLRS